MKNKRKGNKRGASQRRLVRGGSSGQPRWTEDDRGWFLANPHRFFRLRRLYKGEFPDRFSQGETHALVRKIHPGVRDKQFWIDDTKGEDLDTLPNTDAMGVVLWLRPLNHIPALSLGKFLRDATELERTPGVEITADMVFFNG